MNILVGNICAQLRTATWVSCSAIILILLVSTAVAQAPGPALTVQSRQITVTSDPPGAAIWLNEGKAYTCIDKLTPATMELTFHGGNDLKQLVITRFGYNNEKIMVKAAEEKVFAELTPWGAPFFTPPDGATQEIKELNTSMYKELKAAITADVEAFRCTFIKFRRIDVRKLKGKEHLSLYALVDINPSAWQKLRKGSNVQSSEKEKRVGQAALDGGVAEIFGCFRAVAASFPEIEDVVVASFYSSTGAALATEERTSYYTHLEVDFEPYFGNNVKLTPVLKVEHYKETVVKDDDKIVGVFLSMPVGKIPTSRDKKLITDSVLANAAILVMEQ